ncbi:MAG: serine/threonine-protein phosphatase [Myxococcales bacterium]|nr:serine/threonine-protein phosphatase [Myxococcales bacterium]
MNPSEIYRTGVSCNVGIGSARGGRARNEDNYLIGCEGQVRSRLGDREQVEDALDDPTVVLAVADGMGGHEDGETASTRTVQAISRLYGLTRPQDIEAGLREFILETHHRLRPTVAVSGVVKMGTTLTVVWIVGGRAYWAHVGDSRLYLLRADEMSVITKDQTRAEFARRDGRPEPQYPNHLSQNFLYGSRGLGNDEGLRVDPGVDTGNFGLHTVDRLLLCSDGLHGFISQQSIQQALSRGDAQEAADGLVAAAMSAGGDDNVTAVVMEVVGDPAAHVEPDGSDEWDESMVPV